MLTPEDLINAIETELSPEAIRVATPVATTAREAMESIASIPQMSTERATLITARGEMPIEEYEALMRITLIALGSLLANAKLQAEFALASMGNVMTDRADKAAEIIELLNLILAGLDDKNTADWVNDENMADLKNQLADYNSLAP